MKSPIEVATEFWRTPRGCTCGGTDIGVGTMHEPYCGLPSPDDLADLIAQVRREAMQACLAAAREATRRVADDYGTSSPCGPAAGAARVLDAVKAAAREAGAKEPKP